MRFLAAAILAFGIAIGPVLANGGGGVTHPPRPQKCLTVERTYEIAEARGDLIVFDVKKTHEVARFAHHFNNIKPVTNYTFSRAIGIVNVDNPHMALLVLYGGKKEQCGFAMPIPRQRLDALWRQATGQRKS